MKILVTGATGYVGGRLVPRLEDRGFSVRAVARQPESLVGRVSANVEVVQGDVLDRESLDAALAGVDIAYYLVHSMGADGSFEDRDRTGASNFVAAAEAAGVRRIIYLGGLGRDKESLSAHLRSRHEVGRILGSTEVPLVEFRASVVIGSGSLSFELVRALVERLPFMVTPRWVGMLAQPIAIDDLLDYLVAAAELDPQPSVAYEIGGADVVSYAEIMREYALQRGINLRMLPVPVLTPYLSSLWLGLVTPLYARIGRKLIESISHSTVVVDPSARDSFPIEPVGIQEAIRRALYNEEKEFASTRWSDAVSSSGERRTWGDAAFGSRLLDSREAIVAAPAAEVFAVVEQIGGENGWYRWNFLWQLRGLLDMLAGGVGMRRGRPHPTRLRAGDTIDFWRVEKVETGRRLRLIAEMKLPGRAWLEFEVEETAAGTRLTQTAIFDPVGWFGRAYWYGLSPMHHLVFAGMLNTIKREAERRHEKLNPPLR